MDRRPFLIQTRRYVPAWFAPLLDDDPDFSVVVEPPEPDALVQVDDDLHEVEAKSDLGAALGALDTVLAWRIERLTELGATFACGWMKDRSTLIKVLEPAGERKWRLEIGVETLEVEVLRRSE